MRSIWISHIVTGTRNRNAYRKGLAVRTRWKKRGPIG
jgi:hypothetical protein